MTYSDALVGFGLIYGVILFILYHKIFRVYYIGNVLNGLFTVFLGCFLGGAFLALLTMFLYIPIAIAFAIAGFILSKKASSQKGKNAIRVSFIILAIIIFILGRVFNGV